MISCIIADQKSKLIFLHLVQKLTLRLFPILKHLIAGSVLFLDLGSNCVYNLYISHIVHLQNTYPILCMHIMSIKKPNKSVKSIPLSCETSYLHGFLSFSLFLSFLRR